jgi:hypothetical protein
MPRGTSRRDAEGTFMEITHGDGLPFAHSRWCHRFASQTPSAVVAYLFYGQRKRKGLQDVHAHPISSGLGNPVHDVLTLPLVLSALATLGNVLSIILISEGRRLGWYIGVVTLLPTAVLAIATGAYVNALACLVYLGIYVRAIQIHPDTTAAPPRSPERLRASVTRQGSPVRDHSETPRRGRTPRRGFCADRRPRSDTTNLA